MLSVKYSEAAVDVLDILDHMEQEDVDKVPTKFIDALRESASKDYVCNLDYTKRLVEMDLSEETRGILGVMYRHYWCPPEKKEAFEKRIRDNEIEFQKELREKYNPDEIFKNQGNILSDDKIKSDLNSDSSTASDQTLVEKKESIFTKIVNKVLAFFKKF